MYKKQIKLLFFLAVSNLFFQNKICSQIIVKATISTEYENGGYNNQDNNVSLGEYAFGGKLKLEDIYLPSRLAKQGKLTLAGSGFGGTPATQYLASLAHTEFTWIAKSKQNTLSLDIGHFCIAGVRTKALWFLGLTLPITQIQRQLDFQTNFGGIATDGNSFTLLESTVKQFFIDSNIDYTDFFQRYVLSPKNITYDPVYDRLSLGDLRLTAFIDWGEHIPYFKTLQIASIFSLPTGARGSYDKLWPIHTGEGCLQIELQSSIQAYTPTPLLNPYLQLSLKAFFPFKESRRVAQVLTKLDLLTLPPRYREHIILPFNEIDSYAPVFADAIQEVTVYEGTRFQMMIGNLSSLCGGRMQWGFLYSCALQAGTTFDTIAPTTYFDYVKPPKRIEHKLLANISYVVSNEISAYCEITQTFAGRSVPKQTNVTLSLICTL